MSDLQKKLASLSPEKRKLLEKKLKEKAGKSNIFPLSFAQQRLWFLNQFESDKAIYNLPSAFKLIGKMDFEALKRSVKEIIKRHESLRTVFTIIHNEPVQVILRNIEIDIPLLDFRKIPEHEKTKKIKQIIKKEASTGFDLKKGPLLRLKVIRITEDEHIIVLVMHHIISDGWSMGIFRREIATIYNSLTNNQPIPLPPLKIQYADYAIWQRKFMSGKEFEKQIKYWKERLGDIPPALQLPYDKKRGAHQTFSGRHILFRLSKETSARLNNIARENDATLFMVLLASFQALLNRYTNQDDISVGTAIANRNRAEIEGLIGFFVNTLVLRTKIDEEQTFRELVEQVKEVTLGAYGHQDLPYEKMVEIIQPKRDLSAPPFFQVFFTYTSQTSESLKLSNFTIEPIKIESSTVKFDLTLSFNETKNGLTGALGYNTDLFFEKTIQRFIDHYIRFLDNISLNPNLPLWKYPIISEEEKRELIYSFNQTSRPVPNSTLHALFEEQVKVSPHSLAILYPAVNPEEGIAIELTYRNLNQKANKLAHYLIREGIQQDQAIGLCAHRSPEMIISILAILKAGGAYLPIDPSYPDERIEFMVNDAKITTVITQEQLEYRFKNYHLNTFCLDRDWYKVESEDITNPKLSISPENLAYIIYTSGSTGQPKGVLVRHRNVVNYVHYAKELFKIEPTDRVLQFASISFDAAAEEIYPTLIGGAALVLRNDAMISSASTFLNNCDRFGITILDLPTAYWHQIHSEIIKNNIKLPKNLKLVIIGGERAIPEYVLEWQKVEGKFVRLLNTYGPTETTIVATAWELPPQGESLPFMREVPIGKPIANVQAYILDQHLTPVPIGVPGELVISGAGVAAGYLNRPELDKTKFLDNPFIPNNKMYRTGDLVRFLPDGNIEFLGRLDQQVKIRGFRIELGEIETAIRKLPFISDVIVIAREDIPGERRLVAYYVLEKGRSEKITDIRKALKNSLPDYMIPTFFIHLDEIPISSTGKINYQKLPAPELNRSNLENNFIKPRNKLEQFLADLLQEVLKIDQIGIKDNFFELGGDSLKAAIFINNLQQELDEILYVVILFDNQTIEELAAYLIKNYPQKIEKKFGIKASGAQTSNIIQRNALTLSAEKIITAKNYLSKSTQDTEAEQAFLASIKTKLPRVFFILSAPRSGSTLLRVMLAGNPKLFSPPELALLKFRTMKERKIIFNGRDSGWLEGLYRAVMEIKNCSFEQAKKIIAEMEEAGFTTHQAYAQLQEWIGEKILVDKTTTYATDLRILKRGEVFFDDAFYLHIVRHPAAMIQSYIDSNLDQVFGNELPFTIREKAEMFWLINNSNIERFFADIPDSRKFFIRYEDLVTKPEDVMRSFCAKAGIPFDEDMLKPYEGQKMRDGVHKESRMVGDPRFNSHKEIDKSSAKKWLTLPEGDNFYYETELLAEKYKYKIAEKDASDFPASPIKKPEYLKPILSFAQQRLWFLYQMDPESPLYNIPNAVRMTGSLDIDALQASLNEIINRHEILRTAIVTINGEANLQIKEKLKITIPIIDISHLNKEEQQSEIKHLSQTEARKPFRLEQAPLLRSTLVKLKEDDHILLFTIHHIVSDGWSTGVLIKEIVSLYSAFHEKKPSPLPPLKIQYTDYAYWQRHWLRGKILKEQIEFWRKQLEGAPPYLDLPTDYPRPSVQTFNGARKHFFLSKELTEKLKRLTRSADATLFMTLLAAYQLLLYRYSGQDDISVGTPIAGRNRNELEPLIGFFVNTLVIRTDLSGKINFLELIKRVSKTALGAFAHQDLPFEKLIDFLNIKRDVSRPPLFQTMFALQNIPKIKIELPGLTLRQIVPENPTSKFELTLEMAESHEGILSGVFEYNTDLFKPERIDRMIIHFKNLLQSISDNPKLDINQYSLMNKDEIKHIISDFSNSSALNYQKQSTLPAVFEYQVQNTPDAIAVSDNRTELSFKDLNERANRLANYLLQKGLKKETIVAIYGERTVDSIVFILAVLKAGGAYLPIDPMYPFERLNYMLEDSNAAFLLISSYRNLNEIDKINTPTIALDQIQEELMQMPIENPKQILLPENLAYVIYTSGSTGKPKGVMIQHRSPLNLAANLEKTIYSKYGTAKRRISLNAPLAFDASVQQIVMMLHGHHLIIIPQDVRYDGKALLEFIRQQKIELLDCVPSQLKLLIQAGLFDGGWSPTDILPGGEAIDHEMWLQLQNNPKIYFYNMYGPTECTVDSTICPVFKFSKQPTIGRPISNSRFYILDKNLSPQPIGITGELYIDGDGLARGYLNRPELTAEKFIPDPFSEQPGARMYKTGDLACFNDDGTVSFRGRIDYQVKLRGFRIELGEIENALRQHPSIKDALVVMREDTPGHQQLVAYLIFKKGQSQQSNVLRDFLKKTLPEYMIPVYFVPLDQFPLTPNGKINRNALPKPEINLENTQTDYVPPTSPKEKILAEIWQEVLGVPKVGIRNNFFELGGDSILAIQMIARAKQHGLQISPIQVFKYQTIAELTAVASTTPVIEAEQGIVTGHVPLTPIQKRFFEKRFPNPHHWNQSLLLEIKEPLQPHNLKEAIKHLISHHDALRLRFKKQNEGWTQWNAGLDEEIPFTVIDLSTYKLSTAKKIISDEATKFQASLNLSNGPILRVIYFDLGNNENARLLIIVHHLAMDGISWRILLEDLQNAYLQITNGKAVQLPPKTTSFKKWAEKLNAYANSDALEEEKKYWLTLSKKTFTPLPIDLPNGINDERAINGITKSLTEVETLELLQDVPPVYNTQINDILLTALAKSFARWYGKRSILINLEGHGREDIFEDVDISRTIGWFTTIYPVYLDLRSAINHGDSIKTIKEQLRQIPNRGIGFGLLRYLSPDGKLQQKLRILEQGQVTFNYLGQFDQALPENSPFKPASEKKGADRDPACLRDALIDISGSIIGGKLHMRFSYSKNIYHTTTIESLANTYMEELRELIRHCKDPKAGGYTASDFELAKLNNKKLDKIMEQLKKNKRKK